MNSMHDLKANFDRGTHHDAQAWQKQQMAAMADLRQKKVTPCEAGNKKQLHQDALSYRDKEDNPVDSGRWLTALAEQHGVGPSDREIDEYEKHYLREFKVRETDSVRRRKVKQYARDRWTIDVIFADAGINLPGPKISGDVPNVQKAFLTSTTQVIFPFYYAAAIQAGILVSPIVDRLIMEDVPVNSHTADHAMMTDVTGDRTTTISSEGGSSTEVIIRATNHPVTLKKYKSKALATYESIRLQRIPIFERGLMRVGQQFMIQITEEAVDKLVAGDGTTVVPGGGAAPTYPCSSTSNPTYKDIVALDTTFPQGYEVFDGIFLMPINVLTKVLNMAEFKDPLAGWHYQNDGAYPTPIGKEIYRWDATAGASGITGSVSGWLTSSMMEVKNGFALVKYTEGGLLVETDRIIDGQWDQVITSTWTAFGTWDRKATVVGTGF